MFQDHPAWIAHQRAIWRRPDAHLFVRPDAHRFMPPGAPRLMGKDAVRYFWPDAASDRCADAPNHEHDVRLTAARASLARLKREVAALAFQLKFRRLLREKAYNPDQPRVPAGNPDGGQWTDGGVNSGRFRVAQAGSGPNMPTTQVAARRISRQLEAQCELQYKQDIFQCKMVGLRECYAQAALRYANCLAGLPIPPLNY